VVRVCEDGGRLRFDVEDDGRGFDPVTVKKGSGLINMTDRLDALGGDMKVDSRPGGGCRLHGSLPLPVAALV
jgi:signal transduction histidine kinase